MKDLVDVPKRARNEVTILPVEHIDQVLEIALAPESRKTKATRRAKRDSIERDAAEESPRRTVESAPTRGGELLPAQPGT